jgi:Zn-dependent protease with chaperone function
VTRRFRNIAPDAFLHPEDRAGLGALQALPGLEALLKSIQGLGIEDRMFAWSGSTHVKLGRAQYPSIHRMVEDACEVLDIPLPEVYLASDDELNAFAFGYNRFLVTVNAGLVDRFRDDELRFVLGHEVGHIACEHMVYRSTAWVLSELGGALFGKLLGPVAGLVTAGVDLALSRWSRASEYSCDRAGLLVLQDPEACATALTRLGGSSMRFLSEFSLDAVEVQARELTARTSRVGRVMDGFRQAWQSHPDPILRAVALLEWARGEEYARLLRGEYPTRGIARALGMAPIEGLASCDLCGRPLGRAPACASCELPRDPARRVSCRSGHLNADTWKFCRSCGAPLGARGEGQREP